LAYKEYKKSLLSNNHAMREAYTALAPQYAIIDAVIAARIEKK
jgi:hypothetical protein